MSKVVRSVKNVAKGYSATQVKVRNATSNDPWGPTGAEMSDIARMTFDTNHDFFEIMDMLDRRLNDKGKNWRHVLKALKVLDYCLHEGSAHVVVWAKDNIYIIKTLREFQYIDEDGRDQGANVRTAAKELTTLVLDEERLRAERKDRKQWKSKFTGLDEGISSSSSPPAAVERPRNKVRPQRNDENDVEYQLALEASKYSAEEEEKRNRNRQDENDSDLEKAIKLSKEEEELRKRENTQSNDDSIFDEVPAPQQNSQNNFPQGFGQQQQPQYQQLGAVDLFGNPIQQQPTSFLQNVYSQPGFDPNQQQYQQGPTATGWGQQAQFPQPTGFDQQNQAQFLQQQPTSFNVSNPYSNTNFQQPQQQQQQQQQQNTQQTGQFQQPGDQNPYAKTGGGLQAPQDSIKPMPTGSNNPFAQFTNQNNNGFGANSTSPTQRPSQPSLSQLQHQQHQQSSLPSLSESQPTTNFASSYQQQQQQPSPADDKHSHLNALLARGNESGQDTYGNIGDLRIPAQHTAPGTFFSSSGGGRTGNAGVRAGIGSQPTGNNPFFNQQFTGAPQQQMPAQTGPAGVNGFGQQGYGQPQPNQQSNNLIDF